MTSGHSINPQIATVQMVSSADFEQNLIDAKRLIIEAAEKGADLVVLPEYFAIMSIKETDKFPFVEKHGDGPLQSMLTELARVYKVWIVAGSHPIVSDEQQRPYGRCYVYNDLGETVTWYDKVHLFDVQVEDSQGSYCESQYTKAGTEAVYFDSPWGKIGLAICYDIRFPELFRQLSEQGCNILIMPAAFTYKTGSVHWEVLIKARAIENLCYFVASAQGGKHQNGRETWGHSCIVSPWGETIAELASDAGLVMAQLDLAKQTKLRKEFPVLAHKKL